MAEIEIPERFLPANFLWTLTTFPVVGFFPCILCSGSGLTSIGALSELFSSVGFTTSLIFSGVILTGFGGTGKPSDKKLGGIISQWGELLFFFSLYGS